MKSVQNYCFLLLNMQIYDIHVSVLAFFVYALYGASKCQRQ